MMFYSKVKILDGSYGFQLNKHLEKPLDDDPLWSAKALITNPEAVIKTHMDYIKAGVDIIETNTYQASILGFVKYLNVSEEEAYDLMQKAVTLAKEAVSRCENLGKNPLIAGSVGPYGAYLHDGSEYTGNYTDHVTTDQLTEYHKPRIKALVEAGVDLLAIETLPSKKEALVLLNIVKQFSGTRCWVSFSCKSGCVTAHDDDFYSTAIEIYTSYPEQIIAVGVNCLAPNLVENLIKDLNKLQNRPIPLIVYANSGENYDPQTGWDNNCEKMEEYIPTWLNLGVKIIGGCCRVCSNYIEKIKAEVVKWEKNNQ